MKALAIAATGMNAQQLNVEVIANNVANINTSGFKRARAEFTDLLYQVERASGAPTQAGGEAVPEGVRVGLGVRPAAVRNLHLQGSLRETGNSLDVALNGPGFLRITGGNGETLYTRAGTLNKDATGQIVTADGYPVQPAMVVPGNTSGIIINEAGEVYARIDGEQQPQLLGQLSLANFANPAGLTPMGGNLYREGAASGAAVIGVPGDVGFATVRQGYLENSNVDAVKEITELISAQRAYEMNSKVIQAADEMLATIAKGIR